LDDVGVTDLFQDFDLSGDSLNILFIFDLVFFQDFDSHLVKYENFENFLLFLQLKYESRA